MASRLRILVFVALVVTGCGTARQSVRGNVNAEVTPTVTTIDPTIEHQGCIAALRSSIASLRPRPAPIKDPSVGRRDQTIAAAQLDLGRASADLDMELDALLDEGCASVQSANHVEQCLSTLSRQLRSLTHAGALALGFASLALELSPTTTKRDRALAMDAAIIRTRAGIDSSLRQRAIACVSRPSK